MSSTPTAPTATPGKSGLVPTNTVLLKDGTTVRVRIEPSLAVDDVVRQLCISLKMQDPSGMYALRDENDELVTNENLRKKVKGKAALKLVNSPALEAVEIVEKLVLRDNRLGIALTSLRKFIREEQFANEFLKKDGLAELVAVINSSHGNTLAYALTAMQNLMDLDYGWAALGPSFVARVISVLASESSLVNVCRPATAILRRLVEAGATLPSVQGAASDPRTPTPGVGPAEREREREGKGGRQISGPGYHRSQKSLSRAPSRASSVAPSVITGASYSHMPPPLPPLPNLASPIFTPFSAGGAFTSHGSGRPSPVPTPPPPATAPVPSLPPVYIPTPTYAFNSNNILNGSLTPSSSGPPPPSVTPPPIYRPHFDLVYTHIRSSPRLLETVVRRLGSADTTTVVYSMMLVNSLIGAAVESDSWWEEVGRVMEGLGVGKAVVRLMSSHTIEDLTSSILDFQANMVRLTYRKKTTPVEPGLEPSHDEVLQYIWSASRAVEELDLEGEYDQVDGDAGSEDAKGITRVGGSGGGMVKWRKLGFESEDLTGEFGEVGVWGLDCLKHFIEQDPDFFAKVVQEQLSRPVERRCPIAKASNEVADLLLEHWAIFGPGYSTSTTFQPFFLNAYKVHALATHFFLRMWNESGATRGDFSRVAALVRSQVKVALRKENARAWHEVEQDFNECEYRAVRDRQMRELELEDDVMTKVPVRNLRAKLYKESFEFVKQQRIQCLLQGAWFVNAMPLTSNASRDTLRRPTSPWKFMRLDNNLKYLHYVDSTLRFPVRSGFEDLPERIDFSLITEIATGTCAPYPPQLFLRSNTSDITIPGANNNNTYSPHSHTHPLTASHSHSTLIGGSPSTSAAASPLSFSLMNAGGSSMADVIAPDQSRWADWVDGLNMLRRDGGHVASTETEAFVQALTEIGLKIRLLNLSGDKADIPSGTTAGNPPTNLDFFFSDLSSYDTQG